ncbi:MAG TPA: hypothetical protein VFZ11_11220 [Gemmatimonadaceae bacterium]
MTSPTPNDTSHRIRPVLKQAEDSLEHHLEEACEVKEDGVQGESTEDLLRLEDELLAAARAVERTETIRKVLEASACPDEEAGATAAAAGGEKGEASCLVREFADRSGRPWRVWQVKPGRSREGLHGERMLAAFTTGWLAFEALDDGTRRRLVGTVEGWEERPDEELIPLLETAVEVPKRTERAKERGAGERAADEPAPG